MATSRRVLLKGRPVGEPRVEDFEVEMRRSRAGSRLRCCCAPSISPLDPYARPDE